MSYERNLQTLRRRVVDMLDGEAPLDTHAILALLADGDCIRFLQDATHARHARLSASVVQQIASAAQNHRVVWQRDALETVLRVIDHAIEAERHHQEQAEKAEAS